MAAHGRAQALRYHESAMPLRRKADVLDLARPQFCFEVPDEFGLHHLEVMAKRGMCHPHEQDAAAERLRMRVPRVEFTHDLRPKRLNLGLPKPLLKLQFIQQPPQNGFAILGVAGRPCGVGADPA